MIGKLKGIIGSKPLLIPARHAINAGMLAACIALAVPFLGADAGEDLRSLLILAGLAVQVQRTHAFTSAPAPRHRGRGCRSG